MSGEFDAARVGPTAGAALAQGQHPFATVLTCSESRVPPEFVFSQGLGDLFVVRVAGAVPDQAVLGSIEYAAEHLNVPVVVVIGPYALRGGQERDGVQSPRTMRMRRMPNLERILSAIRPSLANMPGSGDPWENAVYASVARNLQDVLRLSRILKEYSSTGRVLVVSAVYDLQTGKVDFSNPSLVRTSAQPRP